MGVTKDSFTYIANLLKRKSWFAIVAELAQMSSWAFFSLQSQLICQCCIVERFQHSTCTINLVCHRVLRFLLEPAMYDAIADTTLSERIASNRNFSPYFKDCIGTINGTRISVQPTLADKAL